VGRAVAASRAFKAGVASSHKAFVAIHEGVEYVANVSGLTADKDEEEKEQAR
jgi:hypothetical protein